MKLEVKLNQKSINHAIGELKRYQASLAEKNETFVRRLLDEGIKVARANTGGYGRYISFSKEGTGGIRTVGFLIAEDRKIYVEWEVQNHEKKTAEVSPLLMAEFGSAQFAEVLFNISGVGQGTFPGQTHAYDDQWWYKEWKDDYTGKWRMGTGIKPTHPMYKADMEMIQQVERIAKEVFYSGN